MAIFEFLKNPVGVLRAYSLDGFKSLFAFGQSEVLTGTPPAVDGGEKDTFDPLAAETSDQESEANSQDLTLPLTFALVDSFKAQFDPDNPNWLNFWSDGDIGEQFLENGLHVFDDLRAILLESELGDADSSADALQLLNRSAWVDFIQLSQMGGDQSSLYGPVLVSATVLKSIEGNMLTHLNSAAFAKAAFILDTVSLGMGSGGGISIPAFAETTLHPLEVEDGGMQPFAHPVFSQANNPQQATHNPFFNGNTPPGHTNDSPEPQNQDNQTNPGNPPPAPGSITGTPGDDTLVGSLNTDDTIFGLAGQDTILGDSASNLTGQTVGSDDILHGNGDADFLYGDTSQSLVGNSTGGNDILYGGAGADWIYGDAGANLGRNATGGNDTLIGGAGDDRLFGDVGGNEQGQGGDDILTGGAGDDILLGGGGSDTFSFELMGIDGDVAPGLDTILDFSATDSLDFSGIIDQGGPIGVDMTDLDAVASFNVVGSDLEIAFDGGGSITLSAHGSSGFTSFADIDAHVDYTVILSS